MNEMMKNELTKRLCLVKPWVGRRPHGGLWAKGLLLLVLLGLGAGISQAASIGNNALITNGLWSATTTWNGGVVPAQGDSVFITNASVIVDVNSSCATLYVSNSIAWTNLTINPGITLSVTNSILIPRPATVTNVLNVGNGILNAGGIKFTNCGAGLRHLVMINTGTVTVTNFIGQDVAGASARINFFGAGTLNVGGTYTNGSLVNFPGSTVNYFGANQILYPFATNYYNLTISGSGQKFPTNVLHVLQTLTITNTAVVSQSNHMFLGALKIADGATFTNTSQSLIVTNGTVIGDGASGVFYKNGPASITNWFGDLTINAGALWTNAIVTGPNTFNLGGNFTNNGIFVAGNAICTNLGPSNYFVGTMSLSQLYLNGITTNLGTLTVSSNLGGAGTLVQWTNAVLNLVLSNAVASLNASQTTNTVNYTGANQMLKAINYWNLGLSGTGTKTITNGTAIRNLSIASGTTAAITNLSAFTLNVSNLTLNGSLQVPNTWGGTGSGAVNINSTYFAPSTTGKLNVLLGAAASQLVFGAQPSTTTVGSSITPAVTVQFQDASGYTAITNGNVTISSGNTSFTGGSTLTVAAASGTASFSAIQPLTAGSGKTLTATSGSLTGISAGFLVNKVTPAFSGLSGTQTIGYGDTSVTLSGTVSAAGGLYPASGETVAITISNTTVNATIGNAGAFSTTFGTTKLPALASPGWTITYAYAGNTTNLNAAASDTSTHVIVNQGAVTVTANDGTSPYGTTYSAVGSGRTEFIAAGLHNSETIGSVTITATNTPFNGTLATDPAGNYKLLPGSATGGTFNPANYLITYVPGNLIIDKANLTFNPNATLQTYDGTTLNNGTYSTTVGNYVISGYQNGETASSIHLTLTGSLNFNGSTSTTVKNTNSYALTTGTLAVDASVVSNYTLVFANPAPNAYVITNKAITVTGITANNKTADGTRTATLNLGSAALSGVAAGDTGNVTLNTGSASGLFADAAAGTGKTVSVSGLTLSGSAAPNYLLVQPTTTANITPAALDHYVVSFSAAPYFAGVPFYTYATAKDAYGNTVTTDSSTVVSFTSSSANMTWDGNGDATFGTSGMENVKTLVSGVATINSKDNTAETNVRVTATDGNGKTGLAYIDIDSQVGAYRTQASGNWSDASIWQTFNGTSWVTASAAPDYNNGVITILPTHNVTVTASVSVDQLHVEAGGGLTVNGSQTLTVVANSLPGLELYGAMTNNGTLQINNGSGSVVMAVYETGLLVNAGTVTPTGTLEMDGTYLHAFTTTAGTIPAATWTAGATCLIAGYTSNTSAPGGLNQGFQNFIWGCPNQTGSINLGTGFTAADTFSVTNTGTAGIVLGVNFTATTSATVGSGAYLDCANQVISGGAFSLNAGGKLGIGSTAGITSSGASGNIQTATRSFSSSATYVYDGTANQDVGSGLPAMVYALVDNNAGHIVTLDQSTDITTNLTIASGAQVGLPNGSSSTAYVLYLNGNAMAAGSWGSTASNATHQNNTYFVATTTGIINVTYGAPVTFTGLTGSQTIYYGTAHVTLGGTLSGASSGETVTVTVDSTTTNTTTTSGGAFSVDFYAAKIPHNNFTPHTITYRYAGSANLNLTNDTSTALTVQAISASIGATDAQKTYGTAYTAVGAGQTGFTTAGFVNGETIGTVTITASGTPSGTAVRDEVGDYPLNVSAATGGTVDTNNYNITYQGGTLTVNPATLTITANNTSKTYGTTRTFAGTEFSTSGLLSGDSVTGVTLTSSGAASSATAASTYAIVPSAATGTGLSDYNITYLNGTLTVNPAPLAITANSTSKTYGTTRTFAGTEFTTSGLASGDSVTSVTLTSSGAASTATAASTYSIVPSAATGSGLDNYNLTYNNGTLTVNKATPTVTLTDSSGTLHSGFKDGVTFTATVPADATGDVNFTTNGVALSTATLSSGSATSLAAPGLIRATTNVVAVSYGGDANYDTGGTSITQTVTNHPPSAPDLFVHRTLGLRLYIARSLLTTNYTDADADAITFNGFSLSSSNSVNLVTNSTFLLYPNPVGNGANDTVNYTVTDSYGESTIGHINVVVNPFAASQSATITPSGSSVALKFYGIPGYSYDVQRTIDLSAWQTIATGLQPGSDGAIHYTDDFGDLGGTPPSSADYRLYWHP